MGDRCLVKSVWTLLWVCFRKIRQVSIPSQVWRLLKMSAVNNRDTILEKEEEKKTLTFYIHHQHRNRRSETSITHFCIQRRTGICLFCSPKRKKMSVFLLYDYNCIWWCSFHFDKRQKGSAFVSFYFFGILNKLTLPESRSMHQSCRRRS